MVQSNGRADTLRQTSGTLGRALVVLTTVLGVLIVLERFGALALGTAPSDGGHTVVTRWLISIAKAAPEMLAVLALWWIRGALAAFSRGEFFTEALAHALRRAGIALAIAGASVVVVLPSIERLLGKPPGYVIAYDVDSLVLAFVGIALTLIAHVLKRAAAIQAELDEIF